MIKKSLELYASRVLFDCDDGRSVRYETVLETAVDPEFRGARRRLVFCLVKNDAVALTGYLALMASGAIPLILGESVSQLDLLSLVRSYRPAFIWLPTRRVNDIELGHVVYELETHALVCIEPTLDYQIMPDLALLLGTSGSTGSPKMVRLSHDNLSSNANSISEYLKITPEELPVTTLPPSYSYGLSVLHSHILQGCRFALTDKTFFERGFWDFMRAKRATTMGGVPYQYEMLRKLRFSQMDLPSLRTLTQAGGRLDKLLALEFAEHCAARGMKFYIMYGQAEAGPRISYLDPDKVMIKPDSIGKAIPAGKLWLEREPGIETDTTGELVYQGRNVCLGYAQGYQDLNSGDELGGVLRTGDLARRDDDGDYYIVGRSKRILKLFGHRVNLQDIEVELSTMGYDVVCSGSDNLLDVYCTEIDSVSAQMIKQKIVKRLRVLPVSVRVIRLAALPRTEAGKIQYEQLSKCAAEFMA